MIREWNVYYVGLRAVLSQTQGTEEALDEAADNG
jgi:hypothetical protein